MAADPRGSVWRRWDPHVHLPGTIENDQYGAATIEEVLDRLVQADPPVEVVGITDYATTRSFRRALDARASGAGDGIAMLFPNVELRLEVPTADGPGVNMHLMCAPEHVDHLDRILGQLRFRTPRRVYSPTRSDLIDLGRDHTGNAQLEDEAAFAAGVRQFKVNFAQLQEVLAGDDWAKEHCLVGFAGAKKDGISGVRDPGGSFEALRRSIERFADIIFTSNPSDREFWLGKRMDPDMFNDRYGSRKLCLHGCDAHELATVGKPDLDRYCWLRGDPAFSTLKQTCIEPEFRSHIGKTAPGSKGAARRIDVLRVESSGWFSPPEIQLNPGLVAIIGPRGSGKTALADLIAAGANLDDPFSNPSSFIDRAGDLLVDTIATVDWDDGTFTAQSLSSSPGEDLFALGPPVRYLSQQFVDRLCAVDGLSDGLRLEIERVVFGAIPPDRRLSATTFESLVARRLQGPKEREETHLEAVSDLSEEITSLRMRIDGRAAHVATQEETTKLLEQLRIAIGNMTKQVEPAVADRYSEVTNALQGREHDAQQVSRRLNGLKSLGAGVENHLLNDFARFPAKLRERYPDAVLTDEQWADFRLMFVGDVRKTVADEQAAAEAALNTIRGADFVPVEGHTLDGLGPEDLASLTVTELRAEYERLKERVGLDESRMKDLTRLQEREAELRIRATEAAAHIRSADEAVNDLTDRMADRLLHYRSYFDALLEEETILNELYSPLAEILASGSPSLSKLRFTVQRRVDTKAWALAGEQLIDLRPSGSFRGRGALFDLAKSELTEAWRTGDGEAVAEALGSFASAHQGELRARALADRSDADEYRAWEGRVASWLYSARHVTLHYTIEYDGIEITRLSPGTRGVVLLLLYLAVDRHETVPLIIDQPEENLDPESVYRELVGLFREASQRRQVIIVTHNANLVVNTDADQVIVAQCGRLEAGRLPNLTYTSAGLEDDATRTAVCQILEGGEDAFRERARRLRVEWRAS